MEQTPDLDLSIESLALQFAAKLVEICSAMLFCPKKKSFFFFDFEELGYDIDFLMNY